jgi:trehalose synthase-fused probable maltokinase
MRELPVVDRTRAAGLFDASTRSALEAKALAPFLRAQRWFGGKARSIARVRVLDWGSLGHPALLLLVVGVEFEDGGAERYALPLGLVSRGAAETIVAARPAAALCWLGDDRQQLLLDALVDDRSCRGLLAAIDGRRRFRLAAGEVISMRDEPSVLSRETADVTVARSGAEQSNSSVIFSRTSILKLYRRLEVGPHPELELGRYLGSAGYADIPAILGSMEYEANGERSALAVLHAFVPRAVDGWAHALEHVDRYYSRVAPDRAEHAERLLPSGTLLESAREPLPSAGSALVGEYLDAARTLGTQTAALHLTFARATDPALRPEPLTAQDIAESLDSTRQRARRAMSVLAGRTADLRENVEARARMLLASEQALLQRLDRLAHISLDATKTRCHQDYHLGQLLWTGSRYSLLDFEGEPARSLPERRRKRSPLTDVAGMVRSYSYAAWSGLFTRSRATGGRAPQWAPWATLWESSVTAAFLSAYFADTHGASFIPRDDGQLAALLENLIIDKALYELEYELNNRPDWLRVPIEGLLRLLR